MLKKQFLLSARGLVPVLEECQIRACYAVPDTGELVKQFSCGGNQGVSSCLLICPATPRAGRREAAEATPPAEVSPRTTQSPPPSKRGKKRGGSDPRSALWSGMEHS